MTAAAGMASLKRSVATLLGVGFCTFEAATAMAASPDYCAIYAEELMKYARPATSGGLTVEHIHDRLYHKCLNMDEEPALPTAYAETPPDSTRGSPAVSDQSVASILQDAEAKSPTVDATAIDETIVKQTAAIEDPPVTRKGKWRGSGYARWSPQWRDWCAEHFPNSFDPQTGTIIPYKTETREPCL